VELDKHEVVKLFEMIFVLKNGSSLNFIYHNKPKWYHNMEKLEVSIIVPVYNKGIKMFRCIESILKQTKKNYELILVNDGSTDESGKICDDYAKEYASVKVIHQLNQGVSAARNAGLAVAKGKFITFIDADDFVSPDYLETLILRNEDLAIAGTAYTDPEGHVTSAVRLPNENIEESVTPQNLVKWFDKGFLYSACTCMFRKSVIDSLKLKFDESYTRGEDTVFIIEYAEKCETIRFACKVIYYYVQYGKGGSSTYRIKRENIISLDKLNQYLSFWFGKNNVKSELFDDRSFWIKRELRAYLYDVLRSGDISEKEKKEYFRLLYSLISYQDLDKLFEGTNILIRSIVKTRSPGMLLLCSKGYRIINWLDHSEPLSE